MSLSRTYHPNHELKAEIRTDLGFQSKPAVFHRDGLLTSIR